MVLSSDFRYCLYPFYFLTCADCDKTHDNETKREWMKFLRKLIRYWKLRTKADIALYKFVKNTNLERLNLDEEMEAFVGQFAQKWEVTKSFASADLYNLCGIASCRAIHVSLHFLVQKLLFPFALLFVLIFVSFFCYRCPAPFSLNHVFTQHLTAAPSSSPTGSSLSSATQYALAPAVLYLTSTTIVQVHSTSRSVTCTVGF